MKKYSSFYKSNALDRGRLLGRSDTLEDAVCICLREIGGAADEARESLSERKFYMIGYGPSMVYIKENT